MLTRRSVALAMLLALVLGLCLPTSSWGKTGPRAEMPARHIAIVNGTVHSYASNTWAYSSLATDSSGTHFVVHKLDDSAFSVKEWNGTSWTVHSNLSPGDLGFDYVSGDLDIAIDTQDHIHVAFRPSIGSGTGNTRGVGYAYYDGSSWSSEWVENATHPNGWRNFDDPILTLDASGAPHFLYEYGDENDNNYIRHATNASGSWVIEDLIVTNGGTDELFPKDLEVDASDNLYAFYVREDNQNDYTGNLYYVTKSGGSWGSHNKIVDGVGDGRSYYGMRSEVDSGGHLHVTYSFTEYDANWNLIGSYVYYKTNASGSWVTSTVLESSTRDNWAPDIQWIGGDVYLLVDSWTADWSSDYYMYALLLSGSSAWAQGSQITIDGGSELTFLVNGSDELMLVTEYDLQTIYSQIGTRDDYFDLNAAPAFDAGDSTALTVDEDSGTSNISSLLAATDGDTGQTLTWSVASSAGHGTLAGFPTTESSGGSVTPSGLTYAPDDNYSGDDSFDVEVVDGEGGSDTITVNVTVSDAPEVTSINRGTSPGVETTNADTVEFDVVFSEAVSGVDASDFSLVGDASGTVSGVSGGGSGYTVSVTNVGGNGTLRLDLDDDDSITSDVTSIELGGGGTTGAGDGSRTGDQSYTIDNEPPTAVDDTTATVGEDEGSGILTDVNGSGDNLTDNDTGAAATTPVAAVNGNPSDVGSAVAGDGGGQFTVGADGSVTFDTDGDFDALAAGETDVTGVTVTIQDEAGNTATSSLSVTINGANDAPTCSEVSITTDEDATGETLAACTDVDDSVVSYEVGSPTRGTSSNDGSTFHFDPNDAYEFLMDGASETSDADFQYRAQDAYGDWGDWATAQVTVTGVNDPPIDIVLDSSTITENATAGTSVGTLTTTDVDTGDIHTYTLQTTGDCAGLGPDNAAFGIDGSLLEAAESFDFEARSVYTICVRTEDAAGSTYSEQLVVDVVDEPCDLDVAKTVSDPTPAEDWTIVYTATVTNHGPDHAKDVVVTDMEPVSLTFQSASASHGAYDLDTGVWTVGYLTESVSATLFITAEVDPAGELDLIVNTAAISGLDQPDADPSNDEAEASIVVRGSEFDLTKTVDNAIPREEEAFTYTITLTNRGFTSTAVIHDLLPSELVYVSDTASQGAYDEGTGRWDAGTLGIDGVETLQITAYAITGTGRSTLTNTVTLSNSSRLDPVPGNDTAQVCTYVQQADASEAELTPAAGGVLTYTTNPTDSQPLTTTVEVPADAISSPLTLIYTPLTTPTQEIPGGLMFANRLFDLTAYLDSVPLSDYSFAQPITVTLFYTDDDVARIDEESLMVHFWDGTTWRDAACNAGYDRHPEENWLSVEICHLTDFALVGESRRITVGGTTYAPAARPGLRASVALLMAVAAVGIVVTAVRRRRDGPRIR